MPPGGPAVQAGAQASYSFPAASILATWLWTRLTSARPLVTLVTEGGRGQEQEADYLRGVLAELGAEVILLQVLRTLPYDPPLAPHYVQSVYCQVYKHYD